MQHHDMNTPQMGYEGMLPSAEQVCSLPHLSAPPPSCETR